MIRVDLFTTELYHTISADDPLFKDNDKTSLIVDNAIYKSVNIDDYHHPPRSKSDYEKLHQKSCSSNFQSFNKIPESFDLLDAGTV